MLQHSPFSYRLKIGVPLPAEREEELLTHNVHKV